MKRFFWVTAIFLCAGVAAVFAQASDNAGLDAITNHFAARNFAAGRVTDAELEAILAAGINAPSAMNRQPWHFTVVRDNALAKRIIPQATEGNILIVVSAEGDGAVNSGVVLDCALAVQSMYLAAQAIGLGSRIYTGPVNAVNSRFKTELGLPRNHSAVALIRVGRLPAGVDAVSSASPRSRLDQKVTYK